MQIQSDAQPLAADLLRSHQGIHRKPRNFPNLQVPVNILGHGLCYFSMRFNREYERMPDAFYFDRFTWA